MDLTGKTNTHIAVLYLNILSNGAMPKLDSQFFAVALACDATRSRLAGPLTR